MNCVNTSTSTFKELAKRNNVSESKLELIVHQYWLEDEGNTEFPSDVYIQAQLGNTKYREPSKAVREVWKTKYSKPQEFSSLKEVQQAVTEAQKFFPPSVIVYYKNNNGTFTLSVRQPVASLKHSINDFFKEGTSLDAGHFRTPLKGNQREQLFNIHDGIKRQLMFMEEDQVKETLKTQIQNSDIPKETVEKISSTIDKMTKKQILSEIELMDREQEDFNIVLQDLREAGESIRFQQEKQEPASAIEDEIQFSMDSPKHTFTFADGTVVETPFKLNDQQADALNAMDTFIHSNEAVMTLSGYAGTGKTSLMEILADKARKDGVSIKFTASTNKAAKVLKNRVFEKGFIAQTLHKLFAYELAQDETTEYDAKKHITTRLEENAKYRPGDVIVIDEASMINDELYRDIVQDAKNNRLKIIFVGDKKQLAPVGQKTISSVFKNNQSKVVELTKVERTGDNAILAEATRLRNDIPLTGISSFNSKGQGVAYMPKQKREELEKIIRYFAPNIKANPDYFRILAWSNNVVSEYNNMVRSILGYSSYVPQVGEPMMGYTNWGYKRNASPMKDPYDLVNSESYKVVAVGNPQTLKKSFVRVADGKDVTVEIESIPITLENSVGEVKNFDYIDVKQNAKNRNSAIILAQQKADLRNKYRTAPRGRAVIPGTKGWYAARAGEIERFLFVNDDITKSNPRDPNKPITLQAKVIDFGYAMTVHKSQGSTFTHVLVDDVNISKASGFEDTASSTSSATEVSSDDLKIANETIEPVGPKKKLNIPGLANLLSKKSSQPKTLISQATAPKPANTNPDAADIVQQLKYVAVSRATDTVTIISDNVKKEDSPLNHVGNKQINNQTDSTTAKAIAEVGERAVKDTIRTLESDNTELNSAEKKSIKEILGNTKPRVLIASETTDPVWHAKKIKEMVEEELKKPAKERSFHMMYLITKHDGIPLKELMELKIPKFVHFSITSLGGTKYEPGVMKMDDLLDRIEAFIKDGVLNPNLTTIRIDPIIPGITKKEDIRHIIERASKMGIKQFKFSVMDSYGYTENGERDRFIIQKMEELGYDWDTYYGNNYKGEVEFHPKQKYVEDIFKYMNSLAEEFNIWFNTCGENSHGVKGLSRIKFDMGCINVDSMNAAMGTNDIAHIQGKQRKDCSCYGLKSDALRYTDKCASSCVYCYASHNSNRYVQYYNEDGTLKDNKFTRISEKPADAQQDIKDEIFDENYVIDYKNGIVRSRYATYIPQEHYKIEDLSKLEEILELVKNAGSEGGKHKIKYSEFKTVEKLLDESAIKFDGYKEKAVTSLFYKLYGENLEGVFEYNKNTKELIVNDWIFNFVQLAKKYPYELSKMSPFITDYFDKEGDSLTTLMNAYQSLIKGLNKLKLNQSIYQQTAKKEENKTSLIQSETWQKAQAIQEPSGRRPVEYTSLPGPETKINIYAGTGENADLSNFAERPFEVHFAAFDSVEQGFQIGKFEILKKTISDTYSERDDAYADIVKQIAQLQINLGNTKRKNFDSDASYGKELRRLGKTRLKAKDSDIQNIIDNFFAKDKIEGRPNWEHDKTASNIMKMLLTYVFLCFEKS